MKAAVLHEFGKPLRIEDVEKPSPERGEVVVKMKTSGFCHSDLHAIEGDWPTSPELPIIPGHEGVGIVESLGENVTGVNRKDRVAVWFYNGTCGVCELCLTANENLCEQAVMTGFSTDGTFAEYSKISAGFAIKIPDTLGDVEAAPLTDAGVSAWRAVKLANLQPGDAAGVFGIGGVGHLALQFAKLAGAHVIGVDIGEEKLKFAESLGADAVLDASDPALGSSIRYELGGLKAAICCAPSIRAYEQAVYALKRGGTLVAVGLPAENLEFSIFNTVINGINVKGTLIGTRADLRETLALAASGKVKSVAQTYTLDEANAALEHLKKGKVKGRPVFVF